MTGKEGHGVAPWEFELRVRVPILAYDAPGIERFAFDVIWTPEGKAETTIGDGRAFTVDLLQVALIDLDDISADLCAIGEVITSDDFEEDWFPCFPILILDRLWLEPTWRGRGLGRVTLARMIAALGSASELVVSYPAPLSDGDLGASTPAAHGRAVARLAAYWAPLGFKAYRDGVHVLDLRTVGAREALAAVVASHEGQERV